MRILLTKYLFISFIAYFIVNCSTKTDTSQENAMTTIALAQSSAQNLPRINLDGSDEAPEAPKGGTTETATEKPENETDSIIITDTTPAPDNPSTEPSIYMNRYLPEKFSVEIPKKNEKGENEVNVSKCYIDQAVDSGGVYATNSRLCGVAFDQVKLELHALFLDLALSDIRALCKNKLPTCDLVGQKVDIAISEPIVRKVQELYAYYDYVGLNEYFHYNGYEIKNGVKLPYELFQYEEIDHPVYEYKAVIKRRVISTKGTEVEERPGAADLTILWNKTRKNILFQFHGYAEVFGYKINARRVYDYSIPDRNMNYSTQLGYWSVENDVTLRFGQSASIRECAKDEDCVQHRGIAGYYYGYDADDNGLSGDEVYYHSLRYSTGIARLNGGIVHNRYPESWQTEELLVYADQNQLEYLLNVDDTASNHWSIAINSPQKDQSGLQANTYYQNYLNDSGEIIADQLLANIKISQSIPQFAKTTFWLAQENPAQPHVVQGYAVSGSETTLQFRYADTSNDKVFRAIYLSDGSRSYVE